MVFFLIAVPIIAMIWFGLSFVILQKIIRRDELTKADIPMNIFIASVLFGILVFALFMAILSAV